MSQANPTDAEVDAYAENYVIYGKQTGAWRKAFPDSEAAPETQHAQASTFHTIQKVRIRIEELQLLARQQAEAKHLVTISSITKELDENRALAISEKQPSAATQATMGKAKINGLLVDKQEVESTAIQLVMSPEQYKQARQEAMAADDC